MKRKPLSKKLRFDVFKRDFFQCQYCGRTPPQVLLHVDHIVAVASGGPNDIDNLTTSCVDCNLGKGAGELTNIPESLKDKAERIRESEAQIIGYSKIMAARKNRLEDESWKALSEFMDTFKRDDIKRDWFNSTKRFVDQLGVTEVQESMDIALAAVGYSESKCFKYFCAVCWNKIRGVGNGKI